MKVCKKCGESKEFSQYTSNNSTRDRLRTDCRACVSIANRQRYKEKREHILALTKAYKQTEKGKEITKKSIEKYRQTPHGRVGMERYKSSERRRQQNLEYSKKMYKKYPLQHSCRNILSGAVYRGKIEPQSCQYPNGKCEGRIEAHHFDYNKPLEPTWLCKKHHLIADKVRSVADANRITINPQSCNET